jgi:hypothetical protein
MNQTLHNNLSLNSLPLDYHNVIVPPEREVASPTFFTSTTMHNASQLPAIISKKTISFLVLQP